jgi:hypothetical protein
MHSGFCRQGFGKEDYTLHWILIRKSRNFNLKPLEMECTVVSAGKDLGKNMICIWILKAPDSQITKEREKQAVATC